ncbi:MAG TPA: GPW/gp25 family protein [Kofleriaceae bacterium]
MTAPAQPAPSFLGTGWSFPPSFTAGGAEVAMVSDADDVHQSLQILVATSRGERPMQEDFGGSLDDVLFEEMTPSLTSQVAGLIYDAIVQNEPRVELRGVDVTTADEAGVLQIAIDYGIRGTNSRYNMVFPFYLNEATAPGL